MIWNIGVGNDIYLIKEILLEKICIFLTAFFFLLLLWYPPKIFFFYIYFLSTEILKYEWYVHEFTKFEKIYAGVLIQPI